MYSTICVERAFYHLDVNRSTFDENVRGKLIYYLFVPSDLDLSPLELKSPPQLLLSNAMFALN